MSSIPSCVHCTLVVSYRSDEGALTRLTFDQVKLHRGEGVDLVAIQISPFKLQLLEIFVNNPNTSRPNPHISMFCPLVGGRDQMLMGSFIVEQT